MDCWDGTPRLSRVKVRVFRDLQHSQATMTRSMAKGGGREKLVLLTNLRCSLDGHLHSPRYSSRRISIRGRPLSTPSSTFAIVGVPPTEDSSSLNPSYIPETLGESRTCWSAHTSYILIDILRFRQNIARAIHGSINPSTLSSLISIDGAPSL